MTGVSTKNKIWANGIRYFITTVLLATGVGKALDIPGFVAVLVTYQAIPGWGLYPVALGMTGIELALSVWLFSGRWLSGAALGSLALHGVFTLWTGVTLLRQIDVPNCGCFGVFLARPLDIWTMVEDLVMVALSAGLYFSALPGRAGQTA